MVKLQVLGNNSKTVNNIKNLTWCKTDQHIKIYLPCNFEVNPITHFDRLFKLEKRGDEVLPPFFLICIIGQNRQKFKVHKKSRNIC
jgi:hypothetical protein